MWRTQELWCVSATFGVREIWSFKMYSSEITTSYKWNQSFDLGFELI
jgi:hypothetical protein